ncbi:hypothetical protein J2Y63_004184 [Shinella sp. BE166]|uniref:hypothetical protein n=1 Tax=Shinella sp. BE166 TaxID=3373918 RepID=UPI003EB6E715
MGWVVVVGVVLIGLIFQMSKSKGSTTPAISANPATPSVEESRQRLAAMVDHNKRRAAILPDDEARELAEALRVDAETYWSHAFNTARQAGKDERFCTHLGLFSTACAILTGEQHPPKSLNGGLNLETVPFESLQTDEARSAFIEYCVAKVMPAQADWSALNTALLKFGDEVFAKSKSQPNPDGYIFEMIYRETLDWQKFLAEAISVQLKSRNQ